MHYLSAFAQQLLTNHMVPVTPHGLRATNRWREIFFFFDWQVGGPVTVGYGACEKVTDGSVSATRGTVSISWMVRAFPVGIDPCVYFLISSLL